MSEESNVNRPSPAAINALLGAISGVIFDTPPGESSRRPDMFAEAVHELQVAGTGPTIVAISTLAMMVLVEASEASGQPVHEIWARVCMRFAKAEVPRDDQ